MLQKRLPGAGGQILDAIVAAAVGGILSVVIGERLPRRWFRPESFPFRAWKWEDGGRIYEKLGVRRWKDFMPDLSRIFPQMVRKKTSEARTVESMRRLAQETCEAETIHWALILLVSPAVAVAAGGLLGALCALLYALGNLIFVVIQRYNRPRVLALEEKMKQLAEKRKSHADH